MLRNMQHNNGVIKTFKHKGLEKFFGTSSMAGIQPYHKQKLRMRLTALDTATSIEDMDLPGFRLHPMKGDRKGLWAIDVSKNWRIVFKFQVGNAYVVDYEDYH
jgi:proteic killer suppression protein